MENHARYVECCAAGERSGLYYTCINSYLQPEEVAYLLENSRSTGADHLDGEAGDRAPGGGS